MRYMPHTEAEIQTMLSTVGAGTIEDLAAHIREILQEAPFSTKTRRLDETRAARKLCLSG